MNHSLKAWNISGIDQQTSELVRAEDERQLLNAWQSANVLHHPVLVLGEGSNILFLGTSQGTVIINRIKGIEITKQPDEQHLHVGAGENWHHLVQHTLQLGTPGLENLAFIPNCVGSSPIQNTGAYGVELQRVCEYVNCVELSTGKHPRVSATEYRFGYRDSTFKHEYQDRFAVIAVGLRLSKQWHPVLTYGDLTRLDPTTVTPQQVFDSARHMHTTKLPDPKVNGNAGSFLKNPVVTAETAQELLARFPAAPHYPQADGSVKLAVSWLIDQCQLKGMHIGGAAVHQQQALVLINADNATSQDVVQLAHHMRQKVGEKFNVWLEPKVRFTGPQGELSAVEIIAWRIIPSL